MSVDIPKDKIRIKDKVAFSVRSSQAVLQYGVGAMVDFKDRTLMTAAPEYWEKSITKIHDERLEKMLHVDFFGKLGDMDDVKYQEGISYVRFPEWYFCPRCRQFKPISEWVKEFRAKNPKKSEDDPYIIQRMKCPKCAQELVVARIVTACKDGHIDDFPWVKWVHCKSYGGPKNICSHPELSIITSATASEGLEGITLKCHCGAKASLKGAFDPDIFRALDINTNYYYKFRCAGRHPWKHTRETCNCSEYPKVLQRGSSSVYFPVTESSLVIPPYSSAITTKIQDSNAYVEYRNTLSALLSTGLPDETVEQIKQAQKENFADKIARETAISLKTVTEILERKMSSSDEQYSTSSVRYRAEEYEALTGELVDSSANNSGFVREGVKMEEYDLPFLKSISLINKVREVQVLIGFTRLKPVDSTDSPSQQATIVSIKEPKTNWYPAYDVKGEGIFIEFDNVAINKWMAGNTALERRVSLINENYSKSFMGENHPRTITGKYLLLHTVSHLLIKQLSFECGYGIASLKERIYCSEQEDGKEMAGILIYTACGDSEGTLGGLVRQGKSDTFPRIFHNAIEQARTCSNDPVCSLSQGQGRDSLNLSACYSCALIPETSCEDFNSFLDRGVVIGTLDNPDFGFFAGVYETKVVLQEKPKIKSRPKMSLVYKGDGTDMSDIPYSEIWEDLLKWATDDSETALLKELKDKSDLLTIREKPILNGTIINPATKEEYECDLIWKKTKAVFLSSENSEYAELINKSGWHCFCGSDSNLTADSIINAIKEV